MFTISDLIIFRISSSSKVTFVSQFFILHGTTDNNILSLMMAVLFEAKKLFEKICFFPKVCNNPVVYKKEGNQSKTMP